MRAPSAGALALTILALAVPHPAAATGPAAHGVLPFIPDDYPKARQAARARKVPIFIEAWAPW
jgi:hypothetical protein